MTASRSTAGLCTTDAVSSSRRLAAFRVSIARNHCCSPVVRFRDASGVTGATPNTPCISLAAAAEVAAGEAVAAVDAADAGPAEAST